MKLDIFSGLPLLEMHYKMAVKNSTSCLCVNRRCIWSSDLLRGCYETLFIIWMNTERRSPALNKPLPSSAVSWEPLWQWKESLPRGVPSILVISMHANKINMETITIKELFFGLWGAWPLGQILKVSWLLRFLQ